MAGVSVMGAQAADGTREAMRLIFENMRELLRVTSMDPRLEDPENGLKLLDAAREIEDQASILSEHVAAHADAEFLADTLERSALLIERYYELGHAERVRSLVLQTAEVCTACHTRLPSELDSPVAADFGASTPMASLSRRERATLQIATRRFDDGLRTLEGLIGDPTLPSAELEPALRAYLVTAIRVKEDFVRATALLERLAARVGLVPGLRTKVSVWLDSLRTLRRKVPLGEALAVAQAHVRNAERRERQVPSGGLIDYVFASGLLHRVSEQSPPALGTARIYFLLGLTEYRISGISWLPQAELYLESAVLAAPGTATALEAYELLAKKVHETYAKEVGTEVPEDVLQHLDRLRQLAGAM